MTTTDAYARLRLRFAVTLARDIMDYRNGDEAKFSRMVNNSGSQVCTEGSHLETITNITTDPRVTAAYPVACRILRTIIDTKE